MKVLVVAHLYPSAEHPGTGIFVAEQVEALRRLGHEVEVVAASFGGPTITEVVGGVTVSRRGLPWGSAPVPSRVKLVRAAWAYERMLRGELDSRGGSVDLVHAHYGYPDGWAAARAASSRGVPVVVTLHGSDVTRQLQSAGQRMLMAGGLQKADKIVAVSEALASELARLVPALASRAVVVPNGYNDAHVGLVEERDRRYFLFVGSLVPVKNPDVLLSAFEKMMSKTELGLRFVGDGPLRDALEARVIADGLADRVEFTGFVPHQELEKQFEGAVALVLPSSREGMPVVAIEALATGTPVVASRVGGLPELVLDDRQGRLVTPSDSSELAEALLWVAQAEWEPRLVREHAPIITWDQNASLLTSVYRGVIGETREASDA